MSGHVRLHRIRVVLKMTRHVELHASHAAIIYAALCEANGRGFDIEPAIPDGLLLDAVEQCRTALAPGDLYAFGFTLLTGSQQETQARMAALIKGIYSLGERAAHGVKVGGNFRVDRITDLVSGQVLTTTDCDPAPISQSRLLTELDQLKGRKTVTLRFTSPVRVQRPSALRSDGHVYMDGRWCDAWLLVQRMQTRQRQIGFQPLQFPTVTPPTAHNPHSADLSAQADPLLAQRIALRSQATATGPGTDELPEHCVGLEDNHLVWLDVSWGPSHRRKSLGGCLGRLRLTVNEESVLPVLVAAQYVGVGGNTAFGFGRFRIEELGPDPTACQRAAGLTELAFRHPAADNVAARYDLASGRISEQMRLIRNGTYKPGNHQAVWIKQGRKRRLLNIPTRLDRGLQRCVNDLLAPGIDCFLESSAVAYRRGLNRGSAARRLREAWDQGYHWALKADFHRFFDSVDHALLRNRLDAYINDDELCDLIMRWVKAGAPEEQCGLPTGAVLSPVLANLFLDAFDERVETEGRRLIRYADDLMLLFKTKEEADVVFKDAEHAAAELSLSLNEQKTAIVDLQHPFRFLGFTFAPQHSWQPLPNGEPVRVDELGWDDSAEPEKPSRAAAEIRLPGERLTASTSEKSVVILGPGIQKLDVKRDRLCYQFRSTSTPVSLRHMERIRSIVVLGFPTLTYRFLKAAASASVITTLVNRSGKSRLLLGPQVGSGVAVTIRRQCGVAEDEQRRLHVARQLIAAKLHNYATLADVTQSSEDSSTAAHLRRLAERLPEQTDVAQILGVEGAAAGRWFGELNQRLHKRFRLERRVSPNASDPVNVMLNIAQSALYQHCVTLLQHEGFSPAIGILHADRSGHQALASDIQEVFRHVMEKSVIEASHQLHASDFVKATGGRFRLIIRPHAIKRLMAIVYRSLAVPVQSADGSDPVDYHLQIRRTIRSLARYLAGSEKRFEPFQHPSISD